MTYGSILVTTICKAWKVLKTLFPYLPASHLRSPLVLFKRRRGNVALLLRLGLSKTWERKRIYRSMRLVNKEKSQKCVIET